ncbi:hypothetical protein KAI32_02950 [Candidatus Pacearchaeota archaeon]|nr:hypothetical protein [Candidatus Pacearchaeota archaeon]
MVNRKKRLARGIESMGKQIKIHEEKRAVAKGSGEIELEEYYGFEIENLKKVKEQKERLLEKQ